MDKANSLFLELVQVALGSRDKLSRLPTEPEWNELFVTAQKQAVAALLLPVIDKIVEEGNGLPKQLIYSWIGIGQQTMAQNRIVNQRCVELTKLFAGFGYRCCILKGQGNATFYDYPLSRAPGDIDIWIDADREIIKRYVTKRYPNAKDSNLHIDFPIYDDVPVEVHYRPTIARSHKYNIRLQEYYDSLSDKCFRNVVSFDDGSIYVPIPEFNLVMQLSHVMGHFFEEGIGLRQIIDLYYLLKKSRFDRSEIGYTLNYLGMERFTKAMMWILHYVLGLEEQYLVAKPDKRRGVLLLNEIMAGGNFGRFDQRPDRAIYSKSPLLYKIVRNLRFFILFPMETFVSPVSARICRK